MFALHATPSAFFLTADRSGSVILRPVYYIMIQEDGLMTYLIWLRVYATGQGGSFNNFVLRVGKSHYNMACHVVYVMLMLLKGTFQYGSKRFLGGNPAKHMQLSVVSIL